MKPSTKRINHLKDMTRAMSVDDFAKQVIFALLKGTKGFARQVCLTVTSTRPQGCSDEIEQLHYELKEPFKQLNKALQWMGLYTFSSFPGHYDENGNYNVQTLIDDGGIVHRCIICLMKTRAITKETHKLRVSEENIRNIIIT